MFNRLFQPCLADLFFNHIGISHGPEVLSTYVPVGKMMRVFTCGAFRIGVIANHPTRWFAVPALMDLKTNWNGINILDSWNTSSPCSQWLGLTCGGFNFVTSMWALLKGYNLNRLLFFILGSCTRRDIAKYSHDIWLLKSDQWRDECYKLYLPIKFKWK